MRTIITTIVACVLTVFACTSAPGEKQAATNQSLADYITAIEDSVQAGSSIHWKAADSRIEAYCLAPASGADSRRAEIDRRDFDRLVGRYWALRIKHMSISDAQEFLERKGRTVEAFLDALNETP